MKVSHVMKGAVEAINQKKYLAMRLKHTGQVLGYNPHISQLGLMLDKYEPDRESIFQSYRIIEFQEYITIKKSLFA